MLGNLSLISHHPKLIISTLPLNNPENKNNQLSIPQNPTHHQIKKHTSSHKPIEHYLVNPMDVFVNLNTIRNIHKPEGKFL